MAYLNANPFLQSQERRRRPVPEEYTGASFDSPALPPRADAPPDTAVEPMDLEVAPQIDFGAINWAGR